MRHPDSALILSLLLLAGALVAGGPAQAAERQFTLREQINVDWHAELLTYPFTAEEGQCHARSLSLTGPDGPLPVQLIEVEKWPGGDFVRSARVAFVSDLAPLTEKVFTLRYGAEATTAPAPESDLRLTPGAGYLELATSRFGMRLLLGDRTYDPPAAAEEVPGPVVALRAPDGTWYGASRMYGPGRLTGWFARLVESGPVLARWQVTYTYEGGRTLDLTVELASGGTHALWDMNVEPYDPRLAAQLTAGIGWHEAEKAAADTAARDGFELVLSQGMPNLQLRARPFPEPGTTGLRSRWGGLQRDRYNNPLPDPLTVDLDEEPPGEIARLMPWSGWWDQMDYRAMLLATPTQGDLFFVVTRDGGEWVEPAPLGTWASYGNLSQRHKWVPLWRAEDGSILLRFSAAPGVRKWQAGMVEDSPWLSPYAVDLNDQVIPRGMWPLDRVKDLVLDWPEDAGTHPRLFATAEDLERLRRIGLPEEEIEELREYVRVYGFVGQPTYRDPNALILWLLTANREYAEEAQLGERLHTYLGKLGRLDRMRTASHLACIYDALIDSELITPEDRRLFQAQMAFFAYLCADAGNWSMERGFASGNQNMSVAHILNQGIIAATLPEHPLAREWSEPALFMMEDWLENSVGPHGEWPESLANYVEVSVSMICVYAVAAKNAGIHDYTLDPRFQRLMRYIAKHYTPPDPRLFTNRTEPVAGSPPSGRGPAYHPVTGLFGLTARATADTDPEFSQEMQWIWLRGGQSTGFLSDRMGGLERIAMDPDLPAATPRWTSERFPQMDVLLRQGTGSPHEWYVNFVLEPKGYTAYYSENGGFAGIWARGVPTTVRFAGKGYAEREEILISRVTPAFQPTDLARRQERFMHTGEMAVTGFAPLPRQDYIVADLQLTGARRLWHADQDHTDVMPQWPAVPAEGQPPLDWKRQVLFLKGPEPAEPAYLLLRDTVSGNQPTMWQFWTLSEKIGTPAEVQDLEAFLADKPGLEPRDARPLSGDRFTAVGQLGVDIEYYVAAPTDTPRHTLRWGHTYYHLYSEYQDSLHLQLPGDGAYFVAYYPRDRAEAPPQFTTLGEGRIIRVSGDWGTDYGFLCAEEAEATAEGASFRGTAASVQDRAAGGLVLSLGAEGSVGYEGWGLASAAPASLRVLPDLLLLDLPPDHAGTEFTLTAPGVLRLHQPPAGAALNQREGRWVVTVPAGEARLVLVRG